MVQYCTVGRAIKLEGRVGDLEEKVAGGEDVNGEVIVGLESKVTAMEENIQLLKDGEFKDAAGDAPEYADQTEFDQLKKDFEDLKADLESTHVEGKGSQRRANRNALEDTSSDEEEEETITLSKFKAKMDEFRDVALKEAYNVALVCYKECLLPNVFRQAGMYPKNPWGRTNGTGHAPTTNFGTTLIERLTKEGEALRKQYKPVKQPKRSATPLPRSAKKAKSSGKSPFDIAYTF